MSQKEPKKPFFSFKLVAIRTLFALVFVVAGIGIERWLTKNQSTASRLIEPILVRQSDPLYPLIKPLVRVDFPPQFSFPEFNGLKDKVGAFIEQEHTAGKVEKASFYLRDSNNAHWAGIGQDEQYHPASLFKLPYLMALYKEVEIKPELLNEKVYFSGKNHNSSDQNQLLVSGHSYTVAELAQAMIKESDNDAKDLLLTKIDPQILAEALNDNGLVMHNLSKNTPDTLSPRAYTTFFRTLYNASFLNSAMSEKALELLSEVDFKDGLVAGTSSDLKIAHKFGEYADMENGQVSGLELHDCGLIYYPNHPYYLCVMTQGYSRDDLSEVIKGVANIAFDEFSKLYPTKK